MVKTRPARVFILSLALLILDASGILNSLLSPH